MLIALLNNSFVTFFNGRRAREIFLIEYRDDIFQKKIHDKFFTDALY